MAASIDGDAYSTDPLTVFDRVQKQAGFKLKNIGDSGEANREGNKRVVYVQPVSPADNERSIDHSRNFYAVTVLNELMHHAKASGLYSDRVLARNIGEQRVFSSSIHQELPINYR